MIAATSEAASYVIFAVACVLMLAIFIGWELVTPFRARASAWIVSVVERALGAEPEHTR